MRQTIIGVLVVVFGLLAPLVLDRFMGAAPEWVWRAVTVTVATIGIAIVLFSEPVYSRVCGARLSGTGSPEISHQFPHISIEAHGRPHVMRADKEQDSWYVVFPRLTLVNNEHENVALDIRWLVPRVLSDGTLDPYESRWIRAEPANEPLSAWEAVKKNGKVPIKSHLRFALSLPPRQAAQGYVAFHVRHLEEQGFLDIGMQESLHASSFLELRDLRTNISDRTSIEGWTNTW